MKSNYFELESGNGWKHSKDEDWFEDAYNATGKELIVGERRINDIDVVVFRCEDKIFRAKEKGSVQKAS